MEDIQAWFKSLPFFTRHYMLGCLVVTAASSLKLVEADKLSLTYDGLFKHYYVRNFVPLFFHLTFPFHSFLSNFRSGLY